MKEYEITVKDVWVIPEEELKRRNDEGEGYLKQLKGDAREKGDWLMNTVREILADILTMQGKKGIKVEEHISVCRDNRGKLTKVDAYLDALKKLVYPELAGGESPLSLTGIGKLGASAGLKKGAVTGGGDRSLGITAEKSWLVILIVLAFLGLLSVVFFFIWQSHLKKARVSPELAQISPESVQMPEVGKSGEEKK
jgi:hypothetical protein